MIVHIVHVSMIISYDKVKLKKINIHVYAYISKLAFTSCM